MPAYEFRCVDCNAKHALIASIKNVEASLKTRLEGPCGYEGCTGSLRRVYSPTAAVFKGSGWAGKSS